MRWRHTRVLVGLGLVALLALPAAAQRGRVRTNAFRPLTTTADSNWRGSTIGQYPGWSYDWPDMEDNLGSLLPTLTAVPQNPRPAGTNIFRMDDPELLKFPVAYLSEPGYWYPTDSEAQGLRTYSPRAASSSSTTSTSRTSGRSSSER